MDDLSAKVAHLKGQLDSAFSVEEMDIIREQLAERAAAAEAAHEQLEWNMRLELARVREAESSCLKAAHEMHRAALSMAKLIGEAERPQIRPAPRERMFA